MSNEMAARRIRTAQSVMEDQVQLMQKLTAGIETVSDSAHSLTESVAKIKDKSNDALTKADEGAEVASRAVSNMGEIDNSISVIADKATELERMTADILQISEVMQGIASNTNLLALNAAIEAARAGEMGRGFAVVAEEVKKLAESSSESAKNVAEIVKVITNGIKDIGNKANVSLEWSEKGKNDVNETNEKFNDITDAIHQLKDDNDAILEQSSELSSASEDMTSVVDVIVKKIEWLYQKVYKLQMT